jgi:hypothetical protein
VSSFVSTDSRRVLEHAALYGQVGMYVIIMAIMQFFQIRSAYLFAGLSVTGLLGIYGSEIMGLIKGRPQTNVDFPFAYLLLGAANVILGVEAVTSVSVIYCRSQCWKLKWRASCFSPDYGHLRAFDREVRMTVPLCNPTESDIPAVHIRMGRVRAARRIRVGSAC